MWDGLAVSQAELSFRYVGGCTAPIPCRMRTHVNRQEDDRSSIQPAQVGAMIRYQRMVVSNLQLLQKPRAAFWCEYATKQTGALLTGKETEETPRRIMSIRLIHTSKGY
jgi:hypothetical protein